MTGVLLALWLLAALLITPLELELQAALADSLTGQACLRIWRVPLHAGFRTSRAGNGLRIWLRGQRLDTPERPAPPVNPTRLKVLLGTLLRSDHARRMLLRGVHLRQGMLQARLSLRDAAKTALVCGAANLIQTFFPGKLRTEVLPDFWSGHSAFALRLNLEVRLGTLVGAALLTLAAAVLEALEPRAKKEKGEEDAWSIPLEK